MAPEKYHWKPGLGANQFTYTENKKMRECKRCNCYEPFRDLSEDCCNPLWKYHNGEHEICDFSSTESQKSDEEQASRTFTTTLKKQRRRNIQGKDATNATKSSSSLARNGFARTANLWDSES